LTQLALGQQPELKKYAAMGERLPLVLVTAVSPQAAYEKFKAYLHGRYLDQWETAGCVVAEYRGK